MKLLRLVRLVTSGSAASMFHPSSTSTWWSSHSCSRRGGQTLYVSSLAQTYWSFYTGRVPAFTPKFLKAPHSDRLVGGLSLLLLLLLLLGFPLLLLHLFRQPAEPGNYNEGNIIPPPLSSPSLPICLSVSLPDDEPIDHLHQRYKAEPEAGSDEAPSLGQEANPTERNVSDVLRGCWLPKVDVHHSYVTFVRIVGLGIQRAGVALHHFPVTGDVGGIKFSLHVLHLTERKLLDRTITKVLLPDVSW